MKLSISRQSASRAKKLRLIELLKAKKKKRGKKDLWYFDKYILGYKDMTTQDRFHGELCSFVEKKHRKFILVLEPRGALKTSAVTIGYSTQAIVNNPNIRILLCSEEFMTSQKFLSEIKGHFEENPTLRDLYGDFVGKKKWTEKEITVKTRTWHRKEPTITCAGIDVTKVGLHYDIIIVDDPHSTKNTTTREQIEKVKTWYKLLLSLLDPGGKLVVIGTRWHYDDLAGWIIEQERARKAEKRRRRYFILEKDAILNDKPLSRKLKKRDLLWPERLSLDFLLDQRADQGPYIFSCQYRNRPVDDETATFKRSWVKFYNPKLIPPGLPTYAVLDPVKDEDSEDFAAIVVVSIGYNWELYIREVRRGRWGELEVLEEMWRVHKKWKLRKFGIETVAWQKIYLKFLKHIMAPKHKRIPIVELKTDTRLTKKMRIRGMVPHWHAGLFYIPGTSIPLLRGNMAIFVDELLRYPRVKYDDCVDACAYLIQLVGKPKISKIKRKMVEGSFEHARSLAVRTEKKKGRKKPIGSTNLRRVA